MNNLNSKTKNHDGANEINIDTAINSAVDSITHLQKLIKESAEMIATAQYEGAFKNMDQIYSILDLLMKLVRKVIASETELFKDQSTTHQNLTNIEIHLLGVIKALVVSKEKKDYVMVSDLLEYELADNLTQWKIKILLEISKARNTKLKLEA